ncbi:MAG: hypothetical protein KU38_12650 [Sulfurovum sp. FS08-3]|nr:MAG: hypothetical protein KU38_12650 [Sulfurovum sp. FS08-3]
MNNAIEVVEKEIGSVVEIEEKACLWRMMKIFPKDYTAIMEYFEDNSVEPIQTPYARYVDFDWEKEMKKWAICKLFDLVFRKWHFFVGIPTPKKLEDKDNLKADFIAKQKYLKAMHYGAYHKVDKRYKEIYAHAQQNQIKLGNESIEFYLNDPNEVAQDKLETMILIPVVE